MCVCVCVTTSYNLSIAALIIPGLLLLLLASPGTVPLPWEGTGPPGGGQGVCLPWSSEPCSCLKKKQQDVIGWNLTHCLWELIENTRCVCVCVCFSNSSIFVLLLFFGRHHHSVSFDRTIFGRGWTDSFFDSFLYDSALCKKEGLLCAWDLITPLKIMGYSRCLRASMLRL